MKFSELERHESEILTCTYIVGTTDDGQHYYLWTDRDVEVNEVPQDAIDTPECMHGALIGTKEEIVWELENCVGSFREHGDEYQAEEAQYIIDTMTGAL